MIVLPSFDGAELQSSVSFLPKKVVDVRNVEIIRGMRLVPGKIERFGFNIPRNRVFLSRKRANGRRNISKMTFMYRR